MGADFSEFFVPIECLWGISPSTIDSGSNAFVQMHRA